MIEPYQYSELVYIPPNHEIEEKILTKLNKRPLTSHELSHCLELDISNIIYWLNILEKKGKIVIIEKGHVFYKLKKGSNRKVDLLPGVYRKNSKIPQLSPPIEINPTKPIEPQSIKPIENNDFKPISNFRKNKSHLRKVKELQLPSFYYTINKLSGYPRNILPENYNYM